MKIQSRGIMSLVAMLLVSSLVSAQAAQGLTDAPNRIPTGNYTVTAVNGGSANCSGSSYTNYSIQQGTMTFTFYAQNLDVGYQINVVREITYGSGCAGFVRWLYTVLF